MTFHREGLLVLFLFITACGSSASRQATMTAGALTAASAAWTITPTRTNSPTPSETPTATLIPTATRTPRPSPTPTASPTSTLTPDPNRYYSPDRTFSFSHLEGWEEVETGGPYPALIGPGGNIDHLSLRFYVEQADIFLAFYTALVQDKLMERIPSLKQIKEDFLDTLWGENYFRWEFTILKEGVLYHQVIYFYESGDWKLGILYSRLENQGKEYDRRIDETMSTVQFKR